MGPQEELGPCPQEQEGQGPQGPWELGEGGPAQGEGFLDGKALCSLKAEVAQARTRGPLEEGEPRATWIHP